MPKLYLIVGQEFKRRCWLDELNIELGKYGLIADPSESEGEFRTAPRNIRRESDAIGTNRFDYVQFRPKEDTIDRIVVGKILNEAPGFWTASADLSNVAAVLKEISEDLPQARVFAVYEDPYDVKRFRW